MSLRTSAHTGVAIRSPRRETWQLGNTLGEFAPTLPGCHCEPVRTLVWQSVTPQRNFATWQFLGQIRMHFPVFALGTALCYALPQGCGLPRRFAPRNDIQKFAGCLRLPGGTAGKRPCPAHACQVSACPRAKRPCTREHLSVLCMSLRPCPAHACQVSACPRAKRPCTRTHASSFSMSLRTSAHTGAAIRVPAEKLYKLVILRANS